MNFKMLIAGAGLLACSGAFAAAAVTTGAGYVPVVKNVVKVCQKETGQKITESYGGNIGQMLAQVSAGGGANIVITDKTTLMKLKTPVKFSVMQSLGKTPLMLIWKKGAAVDGPQSLASDGIARIAHPDAKAAVYGRAGLEWVNSQSAAFKNKVKPKLMQVAGVPQVASYVVRGEVDAGFVNYQAAMKNKDKLGGVLAVEHGYEPIEMVAAVVDGQLQDAGVQAFLKCLQGSKAKKVLEKAGIR